ncbi:MAG: ABC-type transport auxiliary lipoprotein family protein, partial [Burkholderiaceae bacterium]
MSRALVAALVALLLAACASTPPPIINAVYDLGPLPTRAADASPAVPALPPLALAAVTAPAALGGSEMIYRLAYANDQQLHPYAGSRWSMTPPELFGQRLRARLAAAGGIAANAADTSRDLPLLRVELDDFGQDFSAPATSTARVVARAT